MNDTELIARVRATLSVKLRTDRGIAELAELALQLAAALERALASQQWQPIETAPRDGTPFLIYDHVHKRVFIAHQTGKRLEWLMKRKSDTPTHWMPLPNAPTV